MIVAGQRMGDCWVIQKQNWSIQANNAPHHGPKEPSNARKTLGPNQNRGGSRYRTRGWVLFGPCCTGWSSSMRFCFFLYAYWWTIVSLLFQKSFCYTFCLYRLTVSAGGVCWAIGFRIERKLKNLFKNRFFRKQNNPKQSKLKISKLLFCLTKFCLKKTKINDNFNSMMCFLQKQLVYYKCIMLTK